MTENQRTVKQCVALFSILRDSPPGSIFAYDAVARSLAGTGFVNPVRNLGGWAVFLSCGGSVLRSDEACLGGRDG